MYNSVYDRSDTEDRNEERNMNIADATLMHFSLHVKSCNEHYNTNHGKLKILVFPEQCAYLSN